MRWTIVETLLAVVIVGVCFGIDANAQTRYPDTSVWLTTEGKTLRAGIDDADFDGSLPWEQQCASQLGDFEKCASAEVVTTAAALETCWEAQVFAGRMCVIDSVITATYASTTAPAILIDYADAEVHASVFWSSRGHLYCNNTLGSRTATGGGSTVGCIRIDASLADDLSTTVVYNPSVSSQIDGNNRGYIIAESGTLTGGSASTATLTGGFDDTDITNSRDLIVINPGTATEQIRQIKTHDDDGVNSFNFANLDPVSASGDTYEVWVMGEGEFFTYFNDQTAAAHWFTVFRPRIAQLENGTSNHTLGMNANGCLHMAVIGPGYVKGPLVSDNKGSCTDGRSERSSYLWSQVDLISSAFGPNPLTIKVSGDADVRMENVNVFHGGMLLQLETPEDAKVEFNRVNFINTTGLVMTIFDGGQTGGSVDVVGNITVTGLKTYPWNGGSPDLMNVQGALRRMDLDIRFLDCSLNITNAQQNDLLDFQTAAAGDLVDVFVRVETPQDCDFEETLDTVDTNGNRKDFVKVAGEPTVATTEGLFELRDTNVGIIGLGGAKGRAYICKDHANLVEDACTVETTPRQSRPQVCTQDATITDGNDCCLLHAKGGCLGVVADAGGSPETCLLAQEAGETFVAQCDDPMEW